MNNLATLLYKQGKLEEAGLMSLGYAEVAKVLTGRHFSFGQDKGLVSSCISQSHRLGISVDAKLFVQVELVLA